VTGSRINVLALSPIPQEGAGCRFRVSQYLPYLSDHGIDVTISSFYTPEFFQLVYRHGHYLRKSAAFLRLVAKRRRILDEIDRYDVVLLYREAIPIGPPMIERAIARRGIPIVHDFDDAIFLPNVSEANKAISFLKQSTSRPAEIIGLSRHVMVGNEFLAAYARRFNPRVTVVPTAVDTTRFAPRPAGSRPSGPLVVGWIGSPTTLHYLESIAPILREVAARHPFVLKVSSGSRPVRFPGVSVQDVPWSLDQEVTLFSTCDVGVYPLADDDWARGKCGFKAIQFMACGVPTVASAVGVNREIIRDGENGFLAATPAEWIDKLERLLTEADTRERFARAGRETIEARYSTRVTAPVIAQTIRQVAEERRHQNEEGTPHEARQKR
jgi:glycosyltransferase involved in cell wall biosynthesis